jgi:hypothetical protein
MNNTIFISCGQFSDAEKKLGKQIAELVREETGLEPFFAEEVQDLNGLDANILEALHRCVGFVTVMHPRGEIIRPDGSAVVRSSVWIEQEIAIATYIQRVEKRPLPIIAFKHKAVGREGIRGLLHLNPIEFERESEVLAELPKRLASWASLKPNRIELKMISVVDGEQNSHRVARLEFTLVNDTNRIIPTYEGEIRVPRHLLSSRHWNVAYTGEIAITSEGIRRFAFDQTNFGPVRPHDSISLYRGLRYCTQCAIEEQMGVNEWVAKSKIAALVWIEGDEYKVEKTIEELALDRR